VTCSRLVVFFGYFDFHYQKNWLWWWSQDIFFTVLCCFISCFILMVFNATFNNISVISWQPVFLVVEIEVSEENHQPAASHWQTLINGITMETVACLRSKCHLKQNLIPSWPWSFRHTSCISDFNRLKQKQISELRNENMMTACTPEKENNYLLWFIHIIKKWQFYIQISRTYKCTNKG
jgi:hypothetical protein